MDTFVTSIRHERYLYMTSDKVDTAQITPAEYLAQVINRINPLLEKKVIL